jgi:hypothetical protein
MKNTTICIAAYIFARGVDGFFVAPLSPANARSCLSSAAFTTDLSSPPPTPVEKVVVLKDADAVGKHNI